MKDFEDKVAVITGAGRGIGRGIALRCAKEGMKVVLAGIGMESLTKTEADLQALGVETLVVQTDVRKLEDIENLARSTLERFGAAHMLVNNAGVGVYRTVWESSLNDWEWVMGVNFWGVLYGVRTFIPIMMDQQEECHIINVSSARGITQGVSKFGSYSVSKSGVVALTESLYYELAQYAPHIKVSVYCPGDVSTNVSDCERNRPEELQNDLVNYHLKPDEVAFRNWLGEYHKTVMSIEESADIFFNGIREDKLYIGVQGFKEQDSWITDAVQTRTDNIINERNPIIE